MTRKLILFCALILALLSVPPLASGSAATATPGNAAPAVSSSDSPAAAQQPLAVVETPLPRAPASVLPKSRQEQIVDEVQGIKVSDPYRWLEKGDSLEVKEWMRAQDSYAREELARLPARDALRARLTELYYIDTISPPRHRGGRWFYTRKRAKQEKSVLYWKDSEKGPEHVLIDPNALSPDGSVSLGEWSPSFDGERLAYSLHKNNADSATMYVRDIGAGKDLEKDVIQDAKYASPSWTRDSKGFYYTWLPADPKIPIAELPGYAEVRFHALVMDPAADAVIHPALHDPKSFLGASVSRDGRYLLLDVQHGWTSNDVYFKDLRATASSSVTRARSEKAVPSPTEGAGFRPLAAGRPFLYSVAPWKGTFYVKTNEGASRYHVFTVDPAKPDRDGWKEIVAEGEDPIEGMEIVGDHLVLTYLHNATHVMEVRDLGGKLARKAELPGLGSTSGMIGNPDEDDAYFTYVSFTQVPQIFRTSVKTGKTTLWETIKYPADMSTFTAEQVFYTSRDGTKVSMFLLHRKDMRKNGDNPTLLTGYGGFNVSETPRFNPSDVVWLEHGGVVAIPNLRGGGEYGEEWHKSGMLTHKQNVFNDFIAAAEFLVAEKITRPERLAISGGSNGGLLVGAAMVQRPDLFRAVVCAVPLLDMVRYHLFGAGKTWIEEYGTAENPEQFKALYAYSPYHHVKQGTSYPALLVLSADSDDRVDPMHARKFAAAVQGATSSARPVWMRIERNAGHGGADLVRQRVERSADIYAFVLDQLGVK